jgi:hypothetical protein
MNYQQQNMYNNNMDGTPIEILRQDLKPQNNSRDDETQYTVGSIDTTTDIRNLVKEINTNIESKTTNTKEEKDTDTDTDDISHKSNKTKKSKKSNIKKIKINKNKKNNKINVKKTDLCNTWEDYLYDFILLFIIFMLMSQEFVKNFIGSKIKIINVNNNGVVPFSGVVVYGFIFVTVYICMKILINKAIDFNL